MCVNAPERMINPASVCKLFSILHEKRDGRCKCASHAAHTLSAHTCGLRADDTIRHNLLQQAVVGAVRTDVDPAAAAKGEETDGFNRETAQSTPRPRSEQ